MPTHTDAIHNGIRFIETENVSTGKFTYTINNRFASKDNFWFEYNKAVDADIGPNRPAIPPRKSPKAKVDRNPRFVIRLCANEHSIEWNGKVFDMSGLALKDAAVIRYNVVSAVFDKEHADKMVADYAKEAA